MSDLGKLASRAQGTKGLPQGFRAYSPFPFSGMNLQDSAIAIADQEFVWVENFLRIGAGNYRTAWDVGAPLYSTAGSKRIVSFFFYTIGVTEYVAVFLNDGSAVQVAVLSGAVTTIGGPGTFYSAGSGQLPAVTQWGVLYLLISNRNTPNDYWAWDGATLYSAGSAAPNGVSLASMGQNYSSTPTVTAFGGHGSGMVLTPTVLSGGVVHVSIDDPGSGYQAGDVVQLAFSGGGSDTSAILQAVLSAGGVASVNITNAGSGYTAATVGFSGGGGTGAAATATVGAGVASVAVTNGGMNYTFANVSFTGGGGSGAAATAAITGGVTSATVTAPGSGYTTASVSITGGGGFGATATATLLAGAVTGIVITNPGSNYSSAPTVTITGDGTLATATGTVSGIISAISVTAPGSGYTSAPTVVITGDGSAAAATATNTASGVVGITVTNPGSGYTSAPTVTISGDGTLATGQAILGGAGVQSVTVVNGGGGFVYAPSISFVGGGGTGATGVITLTSTSIARIDVLAGGQNYKVAPTVTFVGGEGTGAAATAILGSGQVIAVNITNGGSGYTKNVEIFLTPATGDPGTGAAAVATYSPTSISGVIMSSRGINYTDAPAVVITPGANHAAYASVELMPFGISGAAIETFQQRVWIANPAPAPYGTLPPGGNFAVSAPGSLTDFATSSGGVLFTNSDSFLQTKYTGIRQSNGYLYFFGDGSGSVVSSVNTSGSPSTTTFNYQNVDPQTGLSWRDAMQDFGRTIIIANETGVYGLYGGSETKISGKLDRLFDRALFPPNGSALSPTGAIATLFDIKHYLMLMTVRDPVTDVPRNVMVTWNEREWVTTSQTVDLIYIGSQKVQSKFQAWGTNGTRLYPLFAQPSTSLIKRLDGKFYGGDNPLMLKDFHGFWMSAQDQTGSAGVTCNVNFTLSGFAIQAGGDESAPDIASIDLILVQPDFLGPRPFWPVYGTGTGGAPFFSIQAKLTTSSPDFTLGHLLLGYVDQQAFYG